MNQGHFCKVLKCIIILATDSLKDAWSGCVSDARGQGPAEWQREDWRQQQLVERDLTGPGEEGRTGPIQWSGR